MQMNHMMPCLGTLWLILSMLLLLLLCRQVTHLCTNRPTARLVPKHGPGPDKHNLVTNQTHPAVSSAKQDSVDQSQPSHNGILVLLLTAVVDFSFVFGSSAGRLSDTPPPTDRRPPSALETLLPLAPLVVAALTSLI